MNAVSIRGDWVGQAIDRRFSLLEWLGGSDTGGVFLTELDGPGSTKAVIKLIPSTPQAEDRFAAWSAASSISHPHLARILHFGRGEIDGFPVIYVITELAEEVLSQILPDRPLSPEEVRDLLNPVLRALAFLHSHGMVHGHLKPSNILVIENEVKLSSDGLIRAGRPAHELLTNDVHNAPETSTSAAAASADIWSLGITLVEALTQEPPIWDAATNSEPVVPASVQRPFSGIARECLHLDPAHRCTLNEVRALLEGRPMPVSQPARPATRHPQKIAQTAPRKFPLIPVIIGLVLLVAIVIVIVLFESRSHQTQTQQTDPPADPSQTETTRPSPPADPKPQTPAPQSAAAGTTPDTTPGAVLNRVEPDVSRKASETIQGKIPVLVRVSVDPTGAVTDAEFATHGPSAYFARLAMESARNWKFTPPRQNGHAVPSIWLLHYEFRRNGADVTAVESKP